MAALGKAAARAASEAGRADDQETTEQIALSFDTEFREFFRRFDTLENANKNLQERVRTLTNRVSELSRENGVLTARVTRAEREVAGPAATLADETRRADAVLAEADTATERADALGRELLTAQEDAAATSPLTDRDLPSSFASEADGAERADQPTGAQQIRECVQALQTSLGQQAEVESLLRNAVVNLSHQLRAKNDAYQELVGRVADITSAAAEQVRAATARATAAETDAYAATSARDDARR